MSFQKQILEIEEDLKDSKDTSQSQIEERAVSSEEVSEIKSKTEKNSKKKVVVIKNYPVRKMIAACSALPMLALFSLIVSAPFLAFYKGNPPVLIGLVLMVIAEILVLFWALSYTDQLSKWKDVLYFKNFKWKNIGLGAVIGLAYFILLQLLTSLIDKLSGKSVGSSDTSSAIMETIGIEKYLIILFMVPIVAPFIEEVVFRGYILGFIRNSGVKSKKFALILGVVISSVFFAAMHYQGFNSITDYVFIVYIAIIGVINSILVIKTGSIWTAIAAHTAYNGVTSLLIMFILTSS